MGKFLQNGKYILDQELGRGGFGITYKATNAVLNQTVVVKTLNAALQQDPNFHTSQHQFQEEARRLARFAHPHIVRVSDFFTEDGLPYIVMDYIPGQTLDTIVLPNHPLPEAIALHYIRQVGEAVTIVHQNGLLHRDIKPQNLILRQSAQQVVLIDFGIAREFTPGVTQAHTHLVSEGYAPIEQYLPQAKRTPATDVYGLAATLYTLLTAQVPIAATLRDRLPLPAPREVRPELSAMVSEAVMRGLAVEPHHRPARVEDWLALLPDSSTQQPESVQAISPSSQAATVAVAPAPRPIGTKAATAAVVPPTKSGGSRLWLIPIVGLAAIVPAVLSYAQLRSPAPLNEPTRETPAAPSPTTAPASEAPAVSTEEIEPSSTTTPPLASDEPTPTDEAPVPDDLATPTEPIEPLPPEAETPVETDPVPDDPDAAVREAEALQRAEEQAREEQKRAEEQAREVQRREEERVRDAQRREEEAERRREEERDREGNGEEGESE